MAGKLEVISVTVNSVKLRWSIAAAALEPSTEGADADVSSDGRPASQAVSVALSCARRCHLDRSHEVAAADRPQAAEGSCEFHFLLPSQSYSIRLQVQAASDAKEVDCIEATTPAVGRGLPPHLARALPEDMWSTYVGPEHELGPWLAGAPEDLVWAFRPDFSMMCNLWVNACFTLPSRGSPIVQCPNPRSRYCLELTKSEKWLRGKKVRRHKGDFRLTVNSDYTGTFRRCKELHHSRGQGTWITDELVEALDRCRQTDGELKIYSIELWDKSSGALAAAIMALSLGDIFHDYTMATMLRDDRSAGAVLSKVVGHLLVQCGYTLWYWGFKNAYMADYDSHYAGCLMDSGKEFWPRWREALATTRAARAAAAPEPRGAVCDLAARVPPGTSLDLTSL